MTLPTGQNLCSFTEKYICQLPNPALATEGDTLYFLGGIPQVKLQNARYCYANYAPTRETPLLLIDTTLLGSGKRGVLLTDQSVYYSEIGRKGSQSLDSIKKLAITSSKGFRITDLSGARTFVSASLPRSKYHVLRLYLENIPSLTLPDPEEILAIIEPWRDAPPWLKGIAGIDGVMLNDLHGTFEAEEFLREECNGLYFTSHRALYPKARWFAFYRDIKGVRVHRHKKQHTHIPHVGHSVLLNLALHAAGAVNDHMNHLYSVQFLLRDNKAQPCWVRDITEYQLSELQAALYKYGISLVAE